MKTFWTSLGKGLVHAAVWCMGHPDEVMAVVSAVKGAKK